MPFASAITIRGGYLPRRPNCASQAAQSERDPGRIGEGEAERQSLAWGWPAGPKPRPLGRPRQCWQDMPGVVAAGRPPQTPAAAPRSSRPAWVPAHPEFTRGPPLRLHPGSAAPGLAGPAGQIYPETFGGTRAQGPPGPWSAPSHHTPTLSRASDPLASRPHFVWRATEHVCGLPGPRSRLGQEVRVEAPAPQPHPGRLPGSSREDLKWKRIFSNLRGERPPPRDPVRNAEPRACPGPAGSAKGWQGCVCLHTPSRSCSCLRGCRPAPALQETEPKAAGPPPQ